MELKTLKALLKILHFLSEWVLFEVCKLYKGQTSVPASWRDIYMSSGDKVSLSFIIHHPDMRGHTVNVGPVRVSSSPPSSPASPPLSHHQNVSGSTTVTTSVTASRPHLPPQVNVRATISWSRERRLEPADHDGWRYPLCQWSREGSLSSPCTQSTSRTYILIIRFRNI